MKRLSSDRGDAGAGAGGLFAGQEGGAGRKAASPPSSFATDWRAEAEQGGYYEALATGEYKKRGLDVEIIQGGPAVDVPQLLATGADRHGHRLQQLHRR